MQKQGREGEIADPERHVSLSCNQKGQDSELKKGHANWLSYMLDCCRFARKTTFVLLDVAIHASTQGVLIVQSGKESHRTARLI